MASRLSPTHSRRRTHIATNDLAQMRFWSKPLEIDEQKLAETINKVGNSVSAVRKELAACLTRPVKDQPLPEDDFGGGDFASPEIETSTDDDRPLE